MDNGRDMMANFLNVFLLGSMIVGCSNQHIVGSIGSPTYASLKERGLREKSEVKLVNGNCFEADIFHLRADSTTFINQVPVVFTRTPKTFRMRGSGVKEIRVRENSPHTQDSITVETAEISEIKFTNRRAGALQGAGRGFLLGFPVGAIMGLSLGDDIFTTAYMKAGILGGYSGFLGGVIGTPIGAISGKKDVFYMPGNDHKGTYVSSEEK